MAGFDPNQPRNEDGEWAEAETGARVGAGLTEDVRNKEMTAPVRTDQGVAEAIAEYLKKMGFSWESWTDNKGLKHFYFKSSDYSELWILYSNFDELSSTVTFALEGNR